MRRFTLFRIGFLSVLSCLALVIGMVVSTGVASAHTKSAQTTASAMDASGGCGFGFENCCNSFEFGNCGFGGGGGCFGDCGFGGFGGCFGSCGGCDFGGFGDCGFNNCFGDCGFNNCDSFGNGGFFDSGGCDFSSHHHHHHHHKHHSDPDHDGD